MNYTYEQHYTKHLRLDFYATIHAQTTQVRRDSSGNKGRRCRILIVCLPKIRVGKEHVKSSRIQVICAPSPISLELAHWILGCSQLESLPTPQMTKGSATRKSQLASCLAVKWDRHQRIALLTRPPTSTKENKEVGNHITTSKIENHRVQITYIFYDRLLRI